MVMETCKQIELFQAHADAANRHNSSASKKPKNKNKGKGSKGKGGGEDLPLHYLQPPAAAAKWQPLSASLSVPSASLFHHQRTLPHAGQGKGKGQGGKGKGW